MSASPEHPADCRCDPCRAARCEFCKGRPVGDASEWLDDVARPSLPCPRCGVTTPYPDQETYVYVWGNNERRAKLKGRTCLIEARGAMRTVLVRFLDNGERVTTSSRALRRP